MHTRPAALIAVLELVALVDTLELAYVRAATLDLEHAPSYRWRMRWTLAVVAVGALACGSRPVAPKAPKETRPKESDLMKPLETEPRASPASGTEADRTDDGRAIVYGSFMPWCATDTRDPRAGLCEMTEHDCRRRSGTNVTPCRQTVWAACFTTVHRLSGNKQLVCAPTIYQCDINARIIADEHGQDFTVDSRRCYVYRYRSGEP